jgi:diadenosine tetraphosphatase ApaH/serine/threonine PP2A family protein phosphatase
MRYLVVSDIHSNMPAFQAVLADAPSCDALLCLGDLVGYGPNPNECIDRLQDFTYGAIAGNHDWGAIGKTELWVFNPEARQALHWTERELLPDNRRLLDSLPVTLSPEPGLLLSHGSPREPIWEYLVDVTSAQASFFAAEFQICLVGHSHIPLLFDWNEETQAVRLSIPEVGRLTNVGQRRTIVNPGSVGQPRDADPRAAYGVLDTEARTWESRRVAYPVEITQERMRARAMPQRLIDRLTAGR